MYVRVCTRYFSPIKVPDHNVDLGDDAGGGRKTGLLDS